MVGESAVAQLPSRVVELLQSGAVGQSGVAQLPSRVVELLQSAACLPGSPFVPGCFKKVFGTTPGDLIRTRTSTAECALHF